MTSIVKTLLGAAAALAVAAPLSAATLIGYSDDIAELEAQEGGGGNEPFNGSLTVNGFTTPSLAKCDVGGSAGLTCNNWEDSSASDGDYSGAFTLNYTSDTSFNWTFDPSLVTNLPVGQTALFPLYVAVKQSTGFELWLLGDDEVTSGSIFSQRPSISHVTFFDSRDRDGGGGNNPPPVPLPAAGWMLLAGVGGLAALRRRKKS